MSKRPKNQCVPESLSPGIGDGFVPELDVLEMYGVSWSTWERDYRTRIPGQTTINGRFFRKRDFLDWFSDNSTSSDNKRSQRETHSCDRDRKMYDLSQEMREAGFMSEPAVRSQWKFSESYFREWLRKEKVPYCTIGGSRWFHRDQLIEWFKAKALKSDS